MKPKKSVGGALFIDRDGVINRMVKYKYGWDSPRKVEDITLVPGIVEIIKWANERSLPVIEISNQPGVAKGKLTQKMSRAIQRRVEELLERRGVHLDKAYICPHHPNGVVPELTCDCHCRKPKPGLLLKAAKEMGLDLEKCIFLGDKETDALAGRAAGCKTIIFVHDEDDPEKVAKTAAITVTCDKIQSLFDAIKLLGKCLN